MFELARLLWAEACSDVGFLNPPLYNPPSFARLSTGSPACRRYIQLIDECKVRMP